MDFTFPFSSCEKANKGVAQPYSAAANLLSCAVILYYIVNAESFRTTVLFGSIFLFEVFHTFSHAVHIPGKWQQTIQHALTYGINAAFIYYFADLTGHPPSAALWTTLVILSILDIYSFFHFSITAYIGTQVALFVASSAYYYSWLKSKMKKGIGWILGLSCLILLLVWNEVTNCEFMMKWTAAPYHVAIELAGTVLFGVMGSVFH
jgi:hypothetical protein